MKNDRAHFLKNIQEIKKAITQKKLVIFVGAGLSVDSGGPSWSALISKFAEEISLPYNLNDNLQIAQMYYNERGHKEFIEKTREVMAYKRLHYNSLHEEVFALGPEHVLTTNFDNLLEQVVSAKAHPFSIIRKESKFPYSENTNLLVKIHGDLEDEDIVLKEDDYLDYAEKRPLLTAFLKSVFTTKTVLFVGYSFSDIDLKIILQSVRGILNRDFQNAYLLSIEDDFHPTMRNYLKNKGINVVCYSDAMVNDVDYISNYLFNGNRLQKKLLHNYGNVRSEKGQALLRLLRFINTYDGFSEGLSKMNALDQMYSSLKRFDGISTLSTGFIGRLQPFAERDDIYHENSASLIIENKAIANFFTLYFDAAKSELKENFFTAHGISKTSIPSYREKLTSVLNWLRLAGIYKIEFSVHDENGGQIPHIIIYTPIHCDCLSCTYIQFDFAGFLQKLSEYTITDTSDIKDDLRYAYGHYKVGNFSESFHLFERVATKAWQCKNMLIYYVSKQNIKYLRNLIEGHERNRAQGEMLVSKSDEIDLTKLLAQLPGMDKDTYSLLVQIHDDDVIKSTDNTINRFLHELASSNLNSVRQFAPIKNPEEAITYSLISSFLFYTNNGIVFDEFTNFTNVFAKAIDVIITSAAIAQKNNKSPFFFHSETIRLIILYGDASSLHELFIVNNLRKINLKEDQALSVVGFAKSFFQSFYELDYFNSPVSNKFTDRQITNSPSFFFWKMKALAEKFILILSMIDIPTHVGTDLVNNLLLFLELNKITKPILYLPSLFRNLSGHFSKEDFVRLLKLSVARPVYLHDSVYLRAVTYEIEKRFPEEKFTHDALIKDIIRLCTETNRRSLAYIYLFSIGDENVCKVVKEKALNHLDVDFDLHFYCNLCDLHIIEPHEYFDKIFGQFEGINDTMLQETAQGISEVLQNRFYRFLVTLYQSNVPPDLIEPYIKGELPLMWKFLLNPERFDYNFFQAKWLIQANYSAILKRLREIPLLLEKTHQALQEECNDQLGKIYLNMVCPLNL